MPERWREEVSEHRDAMEAWAGSDLPLADEIGAILNEADADEVEAG